MSGADFTEILFSEGAKIYLNSIINSIKKKTTRELDAKLIQSRLGALAERVGKVKTLLSPDGSIRIDSFYCSPRLSFGDYGLVPNISDDFKDQVLIEGIAGHGKSILLRYLCSRSITEKGRVALFYELRRLDYSKPLISIIMNDLVELGFPGNSEAIKSLSVENGLEIYLDGFDEIDQKTAVQADRDIDYITKTYEFARIFVSSRPYVGLSKNSIFNTYRAQYLNHQDVFRMIEKLCNDEDVSKVLISKIQEHQGKVLDLLETPLLVTLLVAQYKQTRQLPEQLSDFYDRIFSALFESHDSFKIPYVRRRRLNIRTNIYKQIFQKFSYASLFVRKLDDAAANKISTWALGVYCENSNSPKDFLLDISEISALIDYEDGFWFFIHGSVQEYYAAAYLMESSDEDIKDRAKRLYTQSPVGLSVDQVFRFCNEISVYRYSKFVQIPYFEDKLSPISRTGGVKDSDIISWVYERLLKIDMQEDRKDDGLFLKLTYNDSSLKPMQIYLKKEDVIVQELLSKSNHVDQLTKEIVFKFKLSPVLMSRLRSKVMILVEEYRQELADAEIILEKENKGRESASDFLDSLTSSSKR